MSKPGIQYVVSWPKDTKTTPAEKYNSFFNDEYLPAVIEAGKTKLALRYENIDPSSKSPYLSIFPVEDIAKVSSPEALGAPLKSKTLGSEDVSEQVQFEVRPYERIQTYEAHGHENDAAEPRGPGLLVAALEPKEGEDADFDAWYRKQHLDMLGMVAGYKRCTRYVRADGVKPRYLAVHEFDRQPEEVVRTQLNQTLATEWSKKVLGEAQIFQLDFFRLVQVHGDKSSKL